MTYLETILFDHVFISIWKDIIQKLPYYYCKVWPCYLVGIKYFEYFY